MFGNRRWFRTTIGQNACLELIRCTGCPIGSCADADSRRDADQRRSRNRKPSRLRREGPEDEKAQPPAKMRNLIDMQRCSPKIRPSTAATPQDVSDHSNLPANIRQPPEKVPLDGGGVLPKFVSVERLRIKFKVIFGRFSLDRETRIRRD